ncbi:MAG: hypothetical protein J1E78_04955 [Muribaculaceae bacterium]|nr:hypothetical protein [Muribaculaceae bacterium]
MPTFPIKITGIKRDSQFSFRRVADDEAIFSAVKSYLEENGCRVMIYTEDKFVTETPEEPYIFNMCRKNTSISKLKKLENQGNIVTNTGQAIENCRRINFTSLMRLNSLPCGESNIISTSGYKADEILKMGSNPVWIKRGDSQTAHPCDVIFCNDPQKLKFYIEDFYLRGVDKVVVSHHIEGYNIKFYGVRQQNFFYYIYHDSSKKDNNEMSTHKISGNLKTINFALLKELCFTTADILGVDVFGGDAIIDREGGINIIDFNDWPSFKPCREVAARHIGNAIIKKIKNNQL